MNRNISMLLVISSVIHFSCNKSAKSLFIDNLNWQISGEATWQFNQQEITGEANGKSGFVMTSDTYENFVLELEFMPDAEVNSGVFIRCKSEEMSPTTCYELNIWDNHPNPEYSTGAIVTKSKSLKKMKTINQWNSYKIKAKGNRIRAWINNVKVADIKDSDWPNGYIGLQAAEHGSVKFRKIFIKEL